MHEYMHRTTRYVSYVGLCYITLQIYVETPKEPLRHKEMQKGRTTKTNEMTTEQHTEAQLGYYRMSRQTTTKRHKTRNVKYKMSPARYKITANRSKNMRKKLTTDIKKQRDIK